MPTAPRIEVDVLGRVVGPSGEPIPRTLIHFSPAQFGMEDYVGAITDSLGAYSVRLLSGPHRVDLEPPDGYLSRDERVDFSRRQNRLDFAFSGYRVRGSVLDPDGGVLDSGWVAVNLPGVGHAFTYFRGGAFSMLLPAGRYAFHVVDRNFLSGLPPLDLQSVPVTADTLITFRLGGIPVSGTVLGPDGLPMQDVRVQAEQPGLYVETSTGADGRYRLYVTSDSYRIFFNPPYPFFIIPRVVGPVTITAPASIDCDLSGIQWTGTVRRSGSNDPVSGMTVAVDMLDDAYHRSAAIGTGSQGEFRLIVEPGRQYDLVAYDPNTYRIAASVPGVTATADTTFEIVIPSAPASSDRARPLPAVPTSPTQTSSSPPGRAS